MKRTRSNSAVLCVFFVFAASAQASELPTDVARVADWLAAEGAKAPWSRSKLPETAPSDAGALERVANDTARSPYERMAALALLGAPETERGLTIRAFFKDIYAGMNALHVPHVDGYLQALQPLSVTTFESAYAPTRSPRPPGGFGAADLPLLARMALLEDNGLAMAAMGTVAEKRVVDVLVYAPYDMLGIGGVCNANYQGLRFLCRGAESRSWVRASLDRPGLAKSRRAMIVLTLAEVRDPAALEPLGELIRALSASGDTHIQRHDPNSSILPFAIEPANVLALARGWGNPRLDDALAGYINNKKEQK